ncbi:MAG: CBS domain-containing protein [Acidobacteria bacterium]|nr:MAG: CBS domain-containing protein [Acidobacteriota bacterium]
MRTVKQLLDNKDRDVWTISPDSSVYDALRLMADKNIGALIVMDGDRMAGIFSERDYARKVVLEGKFSRETPVKEIMTSEVYSVTPDRTIKDCMAVMTRGRFRHLPVTQDEKVVGVVSIGDVVKALLSEQDYLIAQLENFIAGGRG